MKSKSGGSGPDKKSQLSNLKQVYFQPRQLSRSLYGLLAPVCLALPQRTGTGQKPRKKLYSLSEGLGVFLLGRNCMSVLCFAGPEGIPRDRSVNPNGRSQTTLVWVCLKNTLKSHLLTSQSQVKSRNHKNHKYNIYYT